MRPSVLSPRHVLSLLLVVLAATLCTVCADKTDTPAKATHVKEGDTVASDKADVYEQSNKVDSPDEDPAPGNSEGGMDESNSGGGDGGAKPSPQMSHIVEQAPAVELLNNGDIDPEGDCKKDIQDFCPKVKPGSSYLAECVQNRIEDEEEGATDFSTKVSPKCKDAVIKYKMKLATNINYDTEMAKACKQDAAQHCNDVEDVVQDGKIITCLREIKPNLSAKCRDHITRAQLAAAKDYRIDAQVHDFCKMDAYKFCRKVEAGSGRVNKCLRDNRDEVRSTLLPCTPTITLLLPYGLACSRASVDLPEAPLHTILSSSSIHFRSENAHPFNCCVMRRSNLGCNRCAPCWAGRIVPVSGVQPQLWVKSAVAVPIPQNAPPLPASVALMHRLAGPVRSTRSCNAAAVGVPLLSPRADHDAAVATMLLWHSTRSAAFRPGRLERQRRARRCQSVTHQTSTSCRAFARSTARIFGV